MFVGLTRATFGLDHVRPGGDRDPLIVRPGQRPFRWLTRPMLAGISTGVIGLVLLVLVSAGLTGSGLGQSTPSSVSRSSSIPR